MKSPDKMTRKLCHAAFDLLFQKKVDICGSNGSYPDRQKDTNQTEYIFSAKTYLTPRGVCLLDYS